MDRRELAHEVYKIFLRDKKASGWEDVEVWRAIAETDYDSLLDFYEKKKEKKENGTD